MSRTIVWSRQVATGSPIATPQHSVAADSMSETSTIVTPLLKALNGIPGVICLRLHAGTTPVRGGYIRQNEKGTPDLLVLLPEPLFIECKLPGEKLSAEQLRFRGRAQKNGITVETAFDVHQGIGLVTKRLKGVEQKELFK